MDRVRMQELFLPRSDIEKVLIMLSLMHDLTTVMRDVFNDGDVDRKLTVSYGLSELNHRIASYAMATILGSATYSDDVIIDIITDKFMSLELPHLRPWVWNNSLQTAEGHRAQNTSHLTT